MEWAGCWLTSLSGSVMWCRGSVVVASFHMAVVS